MKARKYILKNRFDGFPKVSDIELVEETLPAELNDGEILARAICLSVDPYMRGLSDRLMKLGDVMVGRQIALVLESKNPKFPKGSKVFADIGWRDAAIFNPDKISGFGTSILPDLKGLPESVGLGVLGMPGMTAYFGFLRVCQPKEGETVVVNAAGGAVGSLVCQIAQIKGCKVLAFAGTDDKVKWLKEDLGIKFAFNYKEVHLDSILKKYAVEGVDCYFDNVGGEFSFTVVKNMNQFGRISQCGAISVYNEKEVKIPFDYATLIYKSIRMEGFLVTNWVKEYPEGIAQMSQWIQEGKLKFRETRYSFEDMPRAFMELFEGKNTGKAIIIP